MVRGVAVRGDCSCRWWGLRRGAVAFSVGAAFALLVVGCGGGGRGAGRAGGGGAARARPSVRVLIEPAGSRRDRRPDRGVTGGAVRAGGDLVSGRFDSTRTVWRSRWALGVSRRYTVLASARASSGAIVTRRSAFRTFTPARTIDARIIEGAGQTYGVGMPIILYFSGPVRDRAAVERALQVTTSKRVLGAWYWDSHCNMAAVCLYFRPRRYWPAHTRIHFTGHLDGVRVAPGVYGHHTLTQSFTIGSSLTVLASTAHHYMNVYRDGRLFAHWPISSGRPGDDTPNGRYLTIEKANPVDMVGPGYNIEVPWSVRFTWSGDYLHDAFWSVGEQGFTNVSHGCVNMSPADAETYYKMAVPGDPVTIIDSPRAGVWDNGWTMWFVPWKRWVRGSALHRAVRTGPRGSTFVSLRHRPHPRRRATRSAP
jgi:lipoprotein-anchoring transpeptidase ErfK/SrfK